MVFGRKTRFPLSIAEKYIIELHLDWVLRHFGFDSLQRFETLTADSVRIQHMSNASPKPENVLLLIRDWVPFDVPDFEFVPWDGYSEFPFDPMVIRLLPDEQLYFDAMLHRVFDSCSCVYLSQLESAGLNGMDPGMIRGFTGVFFGLGLLSANLTLKSKVLTDPTDLMMAGASDLEYTNYSTVTARQYGVALAYREWVCGNSKLRWQKQLRPDARIPFVKTMKFLQSTQATWIRPGDANSPFKCFEIPKLSACLDSSSETDIYCALMNVMELAEIETSDEFQIHSEMLKPSITRLVAHQNPLIRIACLKLAVKFDSVDDETMQRIKDCLGDMESETRLAATRAVVLLSKRGQIAPNDLYCSLKDNDPGIVRAAVEGILFLQQKEEGLSNILLPKIRKTFNANQIPDLFLIGALDTVSEKAEEHLKEYFSEDSAMVRLMPGRFGTMAKDKSKRGVRALPG